MIKHSIATMYQATADDRGTVQALARELDSVNEDGKYIMPSLIRKWYQLKYLIGGIQFSLSSRSNSAYMDERLYTKVLQYFRPRFILPIRSHLTLGTPESIPLLPTVTFFDYTVISQRRYWASSRNNNIANSLIAVTTGPHQVHVGELQDIFVIDQPALGLHRLGHVRWLVPSTVDLQGSAWPKRYSAICFPISCAYRYSL